MERQGCQKKVTKARFQNKNKRPRYIKVGNGPDKDGIGKDKDGSQISESAQLKS